MPKPPLILIHGYPFDHTLWKEVVSALPRDLAVITPDLPGFGDDPVATAEPSLDVMADALFTLLNLRQLERAVLVGMSMGGYVALSFAERHRERMAGLALLSTQAAADTPEARRSRREMITTLAKRGAGAATEAMAAKLFSPHHPPEQLKVWRSLADTSAEKAGVAGLSWALEAMAQRPERLELLKTITLPVSVVHGMDDQLLSVERAKEMAALLPNSSLTLIPGCGHCTPLEAPDRVAQELVKLAERSESAVLNLRVAPKLENSRPGVVWSPTEHGL